MVVTFRNGSNKDNFWRAIFNQELLRIWIDKCFSLLSIFRLLPFSILVAFKGDLSEKIINITKIIEGSAKRFFTVDCFRSMESWVRTLHTINWFGRLWFLERCLSIFIWGRVMLLLSEIWHFGTNFTFIKIMKIAELIALGLMNLTAVVLKSTCSFTGSFLLLTWVFGKLLDWF